MQRLLARRGRRTFLAAVAEGRARQDPKSHAGGFSDAQWLSDAVLAPRRRSSAGLHQWPVELGRRVGFRFFREAREARRGAPPPRGARPLAAA